MSHALAFTAGALLGVLAGVWFRDAAAHSDAGLLGWEWLSE